ncbi:hypothetical protein [Shewanella gelidii]|uniref:hypothetical protein n=1 Tax=Shewanella gelidii TaxID=1642821 RepID=UPI00166C72CC|nr:hypothetical protein [Shewanella gelidii]MCL1097739.1 hypothetical protein [Shewanella gelidii]
MKLLTLVILALSILLLKLPINSSILIGAVLVICLILVLFSIYKAIGQPLKDKDAKDDDPPPSH